jgi:hypothetical protein
VCCLSGIGVMLRLPRRNLRLNLVDDVLGQNSWHA